MPFDARKFIIPLFGSAAMMEMPKPTTAHKQLEKFAGNWRGDEKMYPSQWDPKGGVSQATMINRVGVDGFALIGDYEQSREGQVCFRGHSVHTVDPKTGDNLLHWFDCMGQGVDVFRGRMDGDRLVLTQQSQMGHMRLSYQVDGPNRLTSKMETSQDGKNWSPLFEGIY